jgi:biopolymer transport protein ExbB
MNLTVWEVLNGHGGMMWVLAFFSVLAVTIGLERLVVQWKFMERARNLAETVSRCLTRGALQEGRSACERSKSPLADVFLVGYARLGRCKKDALQAAVNRERVRVATDLKRRMWILGTIGATAPFIGLAGTVIGILIAFADIAEKQASGLNVVAGPISQALIVTAAGILVAVEAVMIYNIFNARISSIAVEMRMMTDEFLELLDEHGDEGESEKDDDDGDREAA